MSDELKDEKQAWTGQGKGPSLGNRIFIEIISHFGPLPAYLLLILVAGIYTLVDRAGKIGIRAFRSRAGLGISPAAYYRHFFMFGMLLIDRTSFLVCKKSPFSFTCINEPSINALLAEGRGLIMISGHIGNWGISGNLLKDRLNAPMNAVMLDNERADLKEVFSDADANRRFKVIPVGDDPLSVTIPVLNALKDSEIVSFMADRIFGDLPAVRINLFGAPVQFAVGPFQIAAITGAPILPVFTVKNGLLNYRIRAAEPIRIPSVPRGERAEAIRVAVQKFADEFETEAREYPGQWGNFFDLWSLTASR